MTTVGFTKQDIRDAVEIIMGYTKNVDEAARTLAQVMGCNKSVAEKLVASVVKNNLK